MSRLFAAVVKRTEKWDRSKSPMEQPGFEHHKAYMDGLKEEKVIALAGLLLTSSDVLFVFRGESEDEVRARFAADPWQREGLAQIERIEELALSIGDL
jgi:uncharacterized protein YciI